MKPEAIGASGFHPARRYVFWIEPRTRYDGFIAFLRDSGLRNYRLFLPGARPMAQLRAQAQAQGLDLERSFLPYSTVHAGIDETLYATSTTYARWVTEQFFRLHGRPGELPDPNVLRSGIEAMLADRFAAVLRPAMTFAHTVARMARTSLVFVPKAASDFGLQISALDDAVIGQSAVFDVEKRYRGDPAAVAVPQPFDVFEATHRRHAIFDPAEVAVALDRARVALVSNLADKQYRFVCEQIVPPLCAHGRVALLDASLEGAEPLFSPELAKLIEEGRVTRCVQRPGGIFFPSDPVLAAVERCRDLLAKKPPPVDALPGIVDLVPLVSRAVGQHFPPILETAVHQHAAFSRAMGRIEAVAVSPGRYLPAALMVELGNRKGLPTIEIQGGVIARSRRFFRPSANLVLCTDRVSRAIYTDFLGMAAAQVEIVGSARIDQSVVPARVLDPEAARLQLGVRPPNEGPIVAIVTQPMGVERAQRLLDTALAGLQGAGIGSCLIKPHPNETDDYLAAYAKVTERYSDIATTIAARVEAHVVLRAADVLITYFSTMGIEAFVLGKGVISINPFGEPPPFDLCALGVATGAVSGYEVKTALQQMLRPGGLQFYATDPDLSLLRDGRASMRIAEAVTQAIAARRTAA